MALLGTYIDVRTLASLAAEGTVSFAHGLPAIPDMVFATPAASRSSNVSAWNLCPSFDATNVTIQNGGEGASPSIKVMSLVAHSVIR